MKNVISWVRIISKLEFLLQTAKTTIVMLADHHFISDYFEGYVHLTLNYKICNLHHCSGKPLQR